MIYTLAHKASLPEASIVRFAVLETAQESQPEGQNDPEA